MTPHYCRIDDCGAMLLGMRYVVFVLDDGSTVATCPRCARKIRAGEAAEQARTAREEQAA